MGLDAKYVLNTIVPWNGHLSFLVKLLGTLVAN